ncbi:MAG TPA: sulfotransferase, partial [Candidatus Synoicihabitans sp.]|nr:sulfotransferase [Candidatus Synoicihabitans sp.]
MKEWGAALLLAGGVLVLCRIFGLLRASRAVFVRVETALATIGDPRLAEETKEDVLQREALALLRLFARLLASGAAALGLPAGVLWVFDWLGWISWRRVLEITVSAPFLLVVFGGALAWWWWWWRRNRSAARRTVGFENRYGALDRWLHHAAFASRPVQVALANLEDRAFRRRLPRAADLRPVFIAALPRAGTTMLLNVLAATGEFVTHTYRQMPFVLMPVWWDRFSRPFRASDRPRERAHGDGIAVSVDSPEAFEEVLWLTFWPEHYEPGRIRPWMAEENGGGFERFFREHLHKLPLVGRADATTDRRRYLSKNNANIARIAWLARRFPGARFVV